MYKSSKKAVATLLSTASGHFTLRAVFPKLCAAGFFLGSGYFAVDGNLPSKTILP